ncbi:shootin-1-like isoform X2 [Dendronephthya gigantea]|uniref:shootin-1-like isoform X2 n=1 Tax=Dendronephthya gigantea TaxID=151771 RepID=UPI00106CE89E|nr:shootin-1-like isoform X2 [Dendronephthya gigantea]
MGSKKQDSKLCNSKNADKNDYEGKFNTLRIISLKAISEFEDLQKKCEENYSKYLEERENYLRTKKELDVLKEVSGEALGEYDNLHRKFEIEQECRDKAEEYAKQQVKQNKQLKRQSTILLNTLVAKAVDFDLEELSGKTDVSDDSSTDDHGVCNKQIEGLKEQVESLQIKMEELTKTLHHTEEMLSKETEEHKKTKEELENNRANFKQLNRVSLLALDDYSNLQRKYAVEMQCRAQAEKLAAEANREHEAAVKQSELISKELSGKDKLKEALEEISNLTKKLHEQRTEFDEKVKDLENELASSNDVCKLKSLEEKINTFAQGMETLEARLTQAQTRASEAEAKAKKFEELLKQAKEAPEAPPPPPLPPPPPPPPAPSQLLKKFVGIVSSGGKKQLKKSKSQTKEDPRIKAMSEMMDRIRCGKVELRKTVQRQATAPEGGDGDGSAMENLRDVLKAMKRPPTQGANGGENEGQKPVNFGVQLRKANDRKPRSCSESTGPESDFRSVTLRSKPRSQSTGDMLEDENEMDEDLFKLMKKRKAASERDNKESEQKSPTETTTNGQDGNETENGKVE